MSKPQGSIQQIVILYDGFDPALDRRITSALEAAGFSWYASGFNGKERDLAFDLPKELSEIETPIEQRPYIHLGPVYEGSLNFAQEEKEPSG